MNARIERLKELLKQSPDDAFVRFALAKEMEKQNDVKTAVEMLATLVDEQPEYVGAYYHLAALYQQMDDTSRAFATYDKGIAMATEQGDQHALSELRNARMNLEFEL